ARPLQPAQLLRPRPPDPHRSPHSAPPRLELGPFPHREVRKANISPPAARIGLQSSHRAPPDRARRRMCRVLGSVAAEPVSLRHELLDAANPLIRTNDGHDDSGWGMAAYKHAEGEEPICARFPADPRADQ